MRRRPLIMVVDDDQEMRKLLRRALELEGYHVVVASDGNSALSLQEDSKPDLVILDIIMPGLDGFHVLEAMRQRSNVPIIMLTGRHEVTCLHQSLSDGADDYVRKPFVMAELIARIRAKLRHTGAGVLQPSKSPTVERILQS